MPRTAQSNWLIAGLLLTMAGVLGMLVLAAIGLETGMAAFLAGLLMAVVPVPFYVAFALWIDRFEPEPPWVLGVAFLWGASIAVFFALIFNSLNEGILTAVFGAPDASALTNILSAPLVEELAKGTALLLLFVWKRDEFDNVTDGIVYACMVGLGFAMIENVQYYGRAAASSDGAAGVFLLRGIVGPFAHPLYTSATGIGFGLARESKRAWVKWIAPLLGLGAAMLLHGIWNLSASLDGAFLGTYVFIMMPVFFAVIVVALLSLRREARIVRAHLEGVVASGLISADDLIVVTSVRRRIGASARALLRGGFRKWVARRRFHALATELAFHSWRTSREAEADAQTVHARLVEAVRTAAAQVATG